MPDIKLLAMFFRLTKPGLPGKPQDMFPEMEEAKADAVSTEAKPTETGSFFDSCVFKDIGVYAAPLYPVHVIWMLCTMCSASQVCGLCDDD